jgi:hypothetical protein
MTEQQIRAEILEKRDRLPMWVIYHRASDVPKEWCARLFYSLPEPRSTKWLVVADTLDDLRKDLPGARWGTFMRRNAEDDPAIYGTCIL